jgi:hypothetical protein
VLTIEALTLDIEALTMVTETRQFETRLDNVIHPLISTSGVSICQRTGSKTL